MKNQTTAGVQIIDPNKPEYFKIIEQELSIPLVSVYLIGEIGEAEAYYDLFAALRSCPDNSIINMFINSPGGDLFTAVQLINAMRDSKANITCILDGVGHSGASCIFLSGDNFIVKDGAAMLCHFYSGGASGKGNEIVSSVNFHNDYVKKFFIRMYSGFMTLKELDQMFEGKDFWFDKNEIIARLKKMVKQSPESIKEEDELISYDEN
jgi:ATP-dependent protease ClpP protease subunit